MSVFIYGSCVTRDAFAFHGAPALVDYVARSPLGSAFAPKPSALPDGMDLSRNESAFQRRMVQTDVDKGLAQMLAESHFDTLLIDLIDERLQLLPVGGSWITASPEARRCGLEPSPSEVLVGSDDYWRLFDEGLAALIATVPIDKILLNRVLWSTHTNLGDELPNQPYIRRHNDALATAYERVEAAGVRSIGYDPALFVTDPDHKWGPSPFHYAEALYDETLRALSRPIP